jgi:predicted DCC family thiol-disulfide oxidoreductase YuxK
VRIHSQIHTPTNEYCEFPIRQRNKEIAILSSFRGYATPKNQSPTSEYHFDKPCLVYDAMCNLCTTATRILYALDRGWGFKYLPSQQLSQRMRRHYGLTESVLQGQMYVILPDDSILGGSAAMGEICNSLAPFSYISSLLGTSQAQRLYSWIARRRYRLFGCRDTCYAVELQNVKRL